MQRIELKYPDAKPTRRQVYALAHELCKQAGEQFPRTRAGASALIGRLRAEVSRSDAA